MRLLIGFSVLFLFATNTRASDAECLQLPSAEQDKCFANAATDLSKKREEEEAAERDRQIERERNWNEEMRAAGEQRRLEKERQRQVELAKENAARATARAERARYERLVRPTTEARNRLSSKYLTFIRNLFPNLNYIKAELARDGDYFSLEAIHPFFSRYTFSSGPQGPAIEKWVGEHAAALRAARIRLVGVHSETGGTRFTVPE